MPFIVPLLDLNRKIELQKLSLEDHPHCINQNDTGTIKLYRLQVGILVYMYYYRYVHYMYTLGRMLEEVQC